jgi:glutamate/tyrosine decarboxylase-like PLP-dependent enzyme
LKDKIKALEKIALELEPSTSIRKAWTAEVIEYSNHFLDNINERDFAFNMDFSEHQRVLPEGFGDKSFPMSSILETMDEKINTPGLNPASKGHLGYIPGGGIYPSALGDFLAAVTNRYAGIYFGGPGAVKLENELIQWLVKMMQYPSTAHGNLTSGGSIANLIAITTARDAKDIQPENIRSTVIYLSKQTHHCVHKAVRIAGLGYAIVREVPLDDHFRMDVSALKSMLVEDKNNGLNPFLLISSAGTTDTGAMDPINDLCDLAEAYNLWHHVDAAYGGFFILLDEFKEMFKGIDRTDSIVIDPHKGLFLPYGLGTVLIKDVKAMEASHQYIASYMQDADKVSMEISPANLSPELTKHFRGMRMWLPIQLFGLKPFVAALEEKVLLTRYFYQEIQNKGFEVGPFPDLSVMLFRWIPENEDPNTFNEKLMQAIHKDGRVFFSSTSVNGVYWLRIAILCYRTHLHTVDLCLQMIQENLDKQLAEA